MTDVTNFDDAKAMKRMGLPLNTPVEPKTFRRETTKLWFDVARPARKLIGQAYQYARKPGGKSAQKNVAYLRQDQWRSRCSR
jgi:hypothetical protein